jgi:hypothetical protein
MLDQLSHDRLIAKLQHFANSIKQRKIEKESLSIVLEQSDLKSEIRSEILIYEEIMEEYYEVFKDILYR